MYMLTEMKSFCARTKVAKFETHSQKTLVVATSQCDEKNINIIIVVPFKE